MNQSVFKIKEGLFILYKNLCSLVASIPADATQSDSLEEGLDSITHDDDAHLDRGHPGKILTEIPCMIISYYIFTCSSAVNHFANTNSGNESHRTTESAFQTIGKSLPSTLPPGQPLAPLFLDVEKVFVCKIFLLQKRYLLMSDTNLFQNAWKDAVIEDVNEDLLLPQSPPVPAPRRNSHSVSSTSQNPSQPSLSGEKPQPPPRPKPTTLNWNQSGPATQGSVTGPATVSHLPVPSQGQQKQSPSSSTPSPTVVSGQGHITVNLSPVSSPTRSQLPPGRGTVKSSINFPSPTSSPAQAKHPLSYGWADFESQNKNRNSACQNNSRNFAPNETKVPKSTPVPVGFDSGFYNDHSNQNQSRGATVSALSQKRDSGKPISKRHSTDMQNIIKMVNNNPSVRISTLNDSNESAQRVGCASSCNDNAGPSSLGSQNEENASQQNQSSSSTNRKFSF